MRVLEFQDLDFRKIKKDYLSSRSLLEKENYKMADLKKLKGTPYYRAKLNYSDRLLLSIIKYQNKKALLALEIIHNHEYEKSRFLRGASIQEEEVIADDLPEENVIEMKYVHPQNNTVHYLKKFISFDDRQQQIYETYPPVIISGPAGSGKTVLLLEKMKSLGGSGLYVTQSSYLVDHARQLYNSHGQQEKDQEIDFFGFKQLLESVKIPHGQEVTIQDFKKFNSLHSGNPELAHLTKEPQKIFEEIRGVITGSGIESAFLTHQQYLDLGVKQSIFLGADRPKVYTYFEKFLAYLQEKNFYDLNLKSWDYLGEVVPHYDFVVVDEIQDLTPVQLHFILKFLKRPENFIFCGDGHQIVHPNFFSWAKLKSFLYTLQEKNIVRIQRQQILEVITNNFRNAKNITALSNKILLIKNLRFGAIDRESHFLLQTNSEREGTVEFYQEGAKLCQDLNQKTKKSVRWAVITMGEEQKAKARSIFQTPLIFTIHEAKGLEYENVILYNFVSSQEKEFKGISEGITPDDVSRQLHSGEEPDFSRQRDKEDKTLEALKFYVNSAYVAVTRAVDSVIWIESTRKHPFFDLIQAESKEAESIDSLKEQQSTVEDWQLEASRLAAQGKIEQAETIKNEILHTTPVPWEILDNDNYFELQRKAFDLKVYDKKAKQKLYEFAHTYKLKSLFPRLVEAKHPRAQRPDQDMKYVHNTYNARYDSSKFNDLRRDVGKHGPDFKDEMGRPVLMAAALSGNHQGVKYLLERGADDMATDLVGANTLQRLLASMNYQEAIRININDYIQVFDLLAQHPMKFKYKDRAIIIMPHKAEYFLVNYFMGLFSYLYSEGHNYISSQMLEQELKSFPDSILPHWRKTRQYWNGILSKNHCEKTWAPGNLFLLRRIQTGIYIINPELEIEHGGQWIKINDLLRMNFLDLFTVRPNFMRRVYAQLEEMRKKNERNQPGEAGRNR